LITKRPLTPAIACSVVKPSLLCMAVSRLNYAGLPKLRVLPWQAPTGYEAQVS
jgi:hypothetical protein